jgi:hypothetical protein
MINGVLFIMGLWVLFDEKLLFFRNMNHEKS